MTILWRAAATFGLLFLFFMMSACGGSGNQATPQVQDPTPADTEASSPTEAPTQTGGFTSPLYGYSLRLPDGWKPTLSATRVLAAAELPEAGFPMVDTFRGPGKKDFMVVAAQNVGPGTTLEGWEKYVANMTTDCERPSSDETRTELGGEPAAVVVDGGCFGIDHFWLALLHEGRGYHVVWADDRGQFEEVRSSFTFTP
jgi:hypothetical protein